MSDYLYTHPYVVPLYQAPYHNMTRDDRYGVTTAMCCVYISRDTPTMYVCIMPHRYRAALFGFFRATVSAHPALAADIMACGIFDRQPLFTGNP